MRLRRRDDSAIAVYCALATVPGGAPAREPAAIDQAGWQMLVSELPRHPGPATLARWRGRLDALAVRARYSDARRHARQARQAPAIQSAQTLFSLLEQNRVEALAARAFPGVRHNLAALAQERWIRARPEGVVRATGSAWIETFALLARAPMGAPLPPEAQLALSSRWRDWMSRDQALEVQALSALLDDQDAFAVQALRVIAACDPSEAEQPAQASTKRTDRPAPSKGAHDRDTGTSGDTGASGDPLGWAQLPTDDAGSSAPTPAATAGSRQAIPYRAYTSAFDQVVTPAELCDALTLQQRRRELDQRVGPHLGGVMRWAHRLQRRLLALQMRSWQFDLDEGLLDASRLTRLITRPLEPLAYKQETEVEFPDTVVTLLVDNSGSMRGLPIATAAVCAELLGRVLERCGVSTEVLGFTTRSWRGGRARTQWAAAGRPPNPGRLTELRHIVYKSADEPWRRAHPRMGLMLDDDLLKENVDGEALLWAHGRLMRRIEPRRILLVISDGAPLDDTTLEANDLGYLDRHLHTVIDWIERDAAVELAAIGIGHDVRDYYRRAVTLSGAMALGEAMAAQLIDLFEPPARRPIGR